MLLSLGLLLTAIGNPGRLRRANNRAAVLTAAALSACCGILLVRFDVGRALAIVEGTQLHFSGSGLSAAVLAATLCAAAALSSFHGGRTTSCFLLEVQ